MTVTIDEQTWNAWEAERLAAARAARANLAAQSAAEVFLYALRQWKVGAYGACPDPGRWVADCPACGCDRAVTIAEFGDRGPVAIWCRTGCSQPAIIGALAAWRDAEFRDDELDQAREWITYLEERVDLLEAVADRLCDHIASEVVA